MAQLAHDTKQSSPKILRRFAWFTPKVCLWVMVFGGVLLRIAQYSLDISLWIDEVFISLNIIERSPLELLEPLSYRQGAPYGFLLTEKLCVVLFGNSEWALRLFPLLAGICAIGLFAQLAQRFLKPWAAAVAVALFALSDRLIYYSAEVKQYSSDVAVTLLLYLIFIPGRSQQLTWLRCALIAAVGGIAIWVSHPAIFILAGIFGTTCTVSVRRRDWMQFPKYVAIAVSWLASFAAFYIISLRPLTQNEALQASFEDKHDAFMPLLPTSTEDIDWFVRNFFGFFAHPAGFEFAGIAVFCFLIGLYALGRRDGSKLALLTTPIVLTLIASGLHQYPFKPRLVLFLLPLVILAIAAGSQYVAEQFTPGRRWVGIILIALLLFHPAYAALSNLKNPAYIVSDSSRQRVREHIKPVFSYIQQHRQAQDRFHVYYASQYAFQYYLERFGFEDLTVGNAVWPESSEAWFEPALPSYPPRLIVGEYTRQDWSVFQRELDQLKGSDRVWFIFSHAKDRRSSIDEEDALLYLVDQAGTRRDQVLGVEASAYLYDLSRPSEPT